ncbi:hypothetical protein QE152_g36581 [Popillia japonica]|uniref:Uncharacterized protein n=1 Tax=Popillia japonica TaxID=7064 RepID=A0AAW1ID48_POPJA
MSGILCQPRQPRHATVKEIQEEDTELANPITSEDYQFEDIPRRNGAEKSGLSTEEGRQIDGRIVLSKGGDIINHN